MKLNAQMLLNASAIPTDYEYIQFIEYIQFLTNFVVEKNVLCKYTMYFRTKTRPVKM